MLTVRFNSCLVLIVMTAVLLCVGNGESKLYAASSEEVKKVRIEFGSVEVGESQDSNYKGLIGSLRFDVTITNGSSSRLQGFRGHSVSITDIDGKQLSMFSVNLTDFTAEDGSQPFHHDFLVSYGPGLEAGKTVKGHIAVDTKWPLREFPYPPKGAITVSLNPELFEPLLEGNAK